MPDELVYGSPVKCGITDNGIPCHRLAQEQVRLTPKDLPPVTVYMCLYHYVLATTPRHQDVTVGAKVQS